MYPGLELVTDVSAELLTIGEVVRHVRIDDDYQDQDYDRWIKAARLRAEQYTGRAIGAQTWKLHLDRFPVGLSEIILPKPPLASVSSITYTDTAGDPQTWSSSLYLVDPNRDPGQVSPAFNQTYPSTRVVPNAVAVEFVCGYTSLPAGIAHAMLLMIGHWFENRGEAESVLPSGIFHLLDPYVIGDEFHCYAH